MRKVYENNEMEVSLVMGKSRALKPTTVPRLELAAATTSVKLTAMVHEELKYVEDVQSKFLTDSGLELAMYSASQKNLYSSSSSKLAHD